MTRIGTDKKREFRIQKREERREKKIKRVAKKKEEKYKRREFDREEELNVQHSTFNVQRRIEEILNIEERRGKKRNGAKRVREKVAVRQR